MKTRPWPIVLLAFIYLLGPIYNTWSGAQVLDTPYFRYLSFLMTHAPWKTLAELSLYPLAAFAIYSVKGWSYPVYLLILGLDSFQKFQDWRHFSRLFTLPMFLGTIALNALLVGYFLIPAVRAAYFNKRLRWWESKPRYPVQLSGSLKLGETVTPCTVQNISEGGSFITAERSFILGALVDFELIILEQRLHITAKVVHSQPGTAWCYGLQFHHTAETERKMKRAVKALKLLGLRPRTVNPPWWDSLRGWVITLVKTGKGFVPDVPKPPTS
ncbi:MAG: hypothetical protein A2X94_11075 [Bdellovibrionales bacterium GWB1_55_8]|nr:MAG: hypothetical protein A2X94_11075 [Bdellovibrionales bacterium GWB1_55_8]